ncbi:MAG TPA: FG-GAP-like repeat-containing protein [Mycobacteriales bacterium]
MRRFLRGWAPVALVTGLLFVASAAVAAPRAGAAPRTATTAPASTQQVVVTGAYGSSHARLDTYQYLGGGWQHVLSTTAEVGYNGLSDNHCEGCGTTPTGTYGFGSTMYGVSATAPSGRYAYHHLVCGDWWDENSSSPSYNQFVHEPCGAAGPGGGSEALWTETVAYQHFAVVDYNTDPAVPGRGSGIFLHDDTTSGVTAGCIAIAPSALDAVLAWLDPAQNPVIRIGTPAEVAAPTPAYVPYVGDLYGVATQHTGSGTTEVHALSRVYGFGAFSLHSTTALGPTDLSTWQFRLADYNGDGVPDLWAIKTDGASGHTEVHILDGADGYRTFLLHAATALPPTNLTDWTFGVGDYNGDGTPDLYAIDTHDAGSHSTAVFVLNGRNFGQYLLESGTALAQVSLKTNAFVIADANGDGHADIWDVKTQDTGSGHTEVHVLNALSPQQFLVHAATALPDTDLATWTYAAGDYDRDGQADLYAIDTQDAGSHSTAVHILSGRNFGQYLLQTGTALAPTSLATWAFDVP